MNGYECNCTYFHEVKDGMFYSTKRSISSLKSEMVVIGRMRIASV